MCEPYGDNGPCCFNIAESHGLLSLIKGLVQAGKTRMMVHLIWILAFKYDVLLSAIGLFGNSLAYNQMRNAIADFNRQIDGILEAEFGIYDAAQRELYHRHYCFTRTRRQDAGGEYPRGLVAAALPSYVPPERRNIENIATRAVEAIARAQGGSMQGLGWDHGTDYRINCALFFDEFRCTTVPEQATLPPRVRGAS